MVAAFAARVEKNNGKSALFLKGNNILTLIHICMYIGLALFRMCNV